MKKSYKTPGNVLGIDSSMTGFGLAVLDPTGNKLLRIRRYVTYPMPNVESLKVPKIGQLDQFRFTGTDEARINWLANKVVQAIKKYDPCLAVIEDHAFGAQGRGKTVLSELQGVVKNRLYLKNVLFVTKAPTTVKKHVTGNGRADKFDMISAAKTAGHEISDSDRADAWACAKLAHDQYRDLIQDDEENS